MNCKDMETQAVCLRSADGKRVSAVAHYEYGLDASAVMLNASTRFTDPSGEVVYDPEDYVGFDVGVCEIDKLFVDTCFLPDQYAVQWAWAGNGHLQSFDPVAGTWTSYGQTVDPVTGSVVGGYALAFKNDAVDPVIFFQRSGKLYRASPDDPIGTFALVGATLPAAPSSYPCFAFDPSGRLLAGIASGSTVVSIDPATGAATNIGALIDDRDGATLQAGPGDWYFDPNGDWFLMARDTRGATFGVCTGTVLWKIDPSTLVTVRISDSCSPVNGTGAEWLTAGVSLLSLGNGGLYEYNANSDEWASFSPAAPQAINDLSAQWIIPDPIRVTGFIEKGSTPEESTHCLYQWGQDPDTYEVLCTPFDLALPGQFGKCEAESNPFVSDPFAADAGGATAKNPDQVWNEGCSDAGTTMFRTSCDDAGNEFTEYLYGGLQEPAPLKPPGFRPVSCSIAQAAEAETTQWCNNDNVPPTSVFRKELSNGEVTWFDETGEIPEPDSATPGACPDVSPLLPVSEQVICGDGVTYIRRYSEEYVEDADTGLPELVTYQVVWYNQDGEFFNSGILEAEDSVTEPAPYYFGDCVSPYKEVRLEKLCEIDARFLLLIDSGGVFGRYSFYTKTWERVSTLSVQSAGGSADVDNFLLYNFVAPDLMTVIDVNTDTQLPTLTLTSGVLKPGLTDNPVTFSAAAFRAADGYLYAWDTAGADAGLYKVNVQTGVVDFVANVTGVSGSGTSIAIDNATDRLIINGSSGRAYDVDWATGVGTLWVDGPLTANGSTFDTSGNFYVSSSNFTDMLPAGADGNDPDAWVRIIDDFTAGANSIAYYEVKAPRPSCFYRKFGILEDPLADPVYLSDHNVADFSPRTIVGDVDCCDTLCHCDSTSSSSGGGASASDIGAAVESADTYKGPTAQEIAQAMVLADRGSVQGNVHKFTGTAVEDLNLPAGTRGNLVAISDTGSGLVYFTTDGTPPTNTAGANRGEMSGQYLAAPIRNVDLSLLRFDGSSGAADYTVYYEVYL